jgi:prophage regulatory protein
MHLNVAGRLRVNLEAGERSLVTSTPGVCGHRLRPRSQDDPMPEASIRPFNPTLLKRTIRRDELQALVPLGDTTIYEMEQRGEFPRRFALSPRCVVWDLSEVEAWLEARRKGPIAQADPPDVRRRRRHPVNDGG